jgi:DHA1 family tetracycline resistance protein-like MFS transporter
MMYVFLIPYCFGGIAGPSLQGIMSNQVPPNEQGELQGALTALMSLTSVVGPLLMTELFYQFSDTKGEVYFPGAAMIAGAVLTVISAVLARISLKKNMVLK